MHDVDQAAPGPISTRSLFAYPFRIFFLSAGVWAVLAVPAWTLQLLTPWRLPTALPALYWHQHEMLFGLLGAAIAGFLLTAVCNWTQTDRLHGRRLLGLWLVWLGGRLLMATGAPLPVAMVQAVNLAFLPLVMLDAGLRIAGAGHLRRHGPILLAIGVLWAMQIAFVIQPQTQYATGAHLATMTLMLIIGGRITPAFSANWLRLQLGNAAPIDHPAWLDHALLASMLVLLGAVLADITALVAGTALLSALLALARQWRWQGWRVRREPLLWILHLSLLWIPLALLLLAAASLGLIPRGAWIHATGIGAIGGLVLGVMSRVALGHTGRPLVLPEGLPTAFLLIELAALLRVLTAAGALAWTPGVAASTALWTLAFLIFVWRYAPLLARPRADGKAG